MVQLILFLLSLDQLVLVLLIVFSAGSDSSDSESACFNGYARRQFGKDASGTVPYGSVAPTSDSDGSSGRVLALKWF